MPLTRTRRVRSPRLNAAAVAATSAMVMRNRPRTASAPAMPSTTTIAGAQSSASPRMRRSCGARLHVAPDQQVEAAGQHELADARQPAHAGALDRDLGPFDVAGDHPSASVSRLPAIGCIVGSASR